MDAKQDTPVIPGSVLCRTLLTRLFATLEDGGFWDGKRSRIHGRLIHDRQWNWRVSEDDSDRYGCFALALVLLAKKANHLDTSGQDDKITLYLEYLRRKVLQFPLTTLTYGVFNSLVLGQILYPQLNLLAEISLIRERLLRNFHRITDNQHALFLVGASYYLSELADRLDGGDEKRMRQHVKTLLSQILASQNRDGFFLTGDLRAYHHQRVLYVLWAIAAASRVCLKDESREAIRRSLRYLWENRRESADDAFLWHPRFYWVRSSYRFPVPVYLPGSAECLFECHQTFYANAVRLYNCYFDNQEFSCEKKRALEWITNKNRTGKRLDTLTGLGFAPRMMTRAGEIDVKAECFKGSYEIGSGIFAFSDPEYSTECRV